MPGLSPADARPRVVDDVLALLSSPSVESLPAPPYTGRASEPCIMLAVEAMRRHTADAGWQLQVGLQHAGYRLVGRGFPDGETDVAAALGKYQPAIVVLQDKREWEGRTAFLSKHDMRMRFTNVEALRERDDVFKITVTKDSQNNVAYHRQSAEEIGAHAWISYYHDRIVQHVAPFVRPQHLIRTSHSVDSRAIPSFSTDRSGCLLSGAVSPAYPLRNRLVRHCRRLPVDYLPHPGYHANGCVTPQFLDTLSRYKVAICTSSLYGYALRKHVEATACGCRVITDLPVDDVLPEIDGNLVRVPSSISIADTARLVRQLEASYNAELQHEYANRARQYYDWRAVGLRLHDQIHRMRKRWGP